MRAGHRGIVSVVTGGGKTVFALACIDHLKVDTALVLVPTQALLDQWWQETCSFFDLAVEDIHVISGRGRVRSGTVNLAVLNSASRLSTEAKRRPLLLIVDECHKAASEHFRAALDVTRLGSLGLSATPERPYDSWFSEVLVPNLGPVIYEYSYREALADGVIVPFVLKNVVFSLEPDRQTQYDKLTRQIGRCVSQYGADSPEAVGLFLRRSRILNLSLNRVELALRLVARNRGRRVLVFHEDIAACNLIHQALQENGVRASVYHSGMSAKDRVRSLLAYRRGHQDVLVTCRALDEGFNVPETEIGIIAASTATRRQRIQRLGRILRPADGKQGAAIYTLVASTPEIARLKEEEKDLEGVAKVTWSRA